MSSVTVAIPVRNGGALLAGVLSALSRQSVAHELLVCDSGSTDGSPELARSHGARVIEIAPTEFSHGGTRNLLMERARGSHVALLTQDAEPADERWLERMLSGFELARDVAIVYGPYRPRPEHPLSVQIELKRWFATISPDGLARIDRLAEDERDIAAVELLGQRGFFTDANACVARDRWERVPFRDAPYAEDRLLALDMLRAGYAKAFVPEAAVLHSHAYRPIEQLQRCFDEWRALREVYGWREPARPGHLLSQLRGAVGGARRERDVARLPLRRRGGVLAGVTGRELLRLAGALLGSHADGMPPELRRALSLERRGSFEPRQARTPGARTQQAASENGSVT